jgi:hypothetical protein
MFAGSIVPAHRDCALFESAAGRRPQAPLLEDASIGASIDIGKTNLWRPFGSQV